MIWSECCDLEPGPDLLAMLNYLVLITDEGCGTVLKVSLLLYGRQDKKRAENTKLIVFFICAHRFSI